VDGAGSAYVMGSTTSTDFPTTAGATQTTFAGVFDAFVTKLDATGSGLVFSTYLGGRSEDFDGAIAVDGAGSAYVTGYTASTDFPTTAGAAQTSNAGQNDAFVTKLDAAGSALVYSTYLGGSDTDAGFGIAVDGAGSAYVTGDTLSTDFPTTLGAFKTTHAHAGGEPTDDAFVAKIEFGVPLPTSVDECKNGGWKTFGNFKNQGDCVSFVATKGKNPPSGS
jgi:Beta-propeller repeat